MTRRRPPRRVLVLPQEIAGVGAGMVRGLRAAGLPADLLVRGRHPFDYTRPAPVVRRLARLQAVLTGLDLARGVLRWPAFVLSLMLRVACLPWLWQRYDAFVYLGPTTLTGLAVERRLARHFGGVVVTVFLGSDARPPYLDGWFADPVDGDVDLDDLRRRTRATARRVRSAEAASTYVVNHPPTAAFHRRKFVDFATLGFPSPDIGAPTRNRAPDDPTVRVVHAPSVPQKGTAAIRAAVTTLRDREGLPVDYVELDGVPHTEVVAAITDADIVVDQLYSDVILAGVSTEAAVVGTLPLVYGYAAEELTATADSLGTGLRHYHPPEDLLETLRRFVVDHELRAEVAGNVHGAVAREWSAAAVGARYRRLLTEGPDEAWLRDPARLTYVGGWGLHRDTRRAVVRALAGSGRTGDFGLPAGSVLLRALLDDAGAEG